MQRCKVVYEDETGTMRQKNVKLAKCSDQIKKIVAQFRSEFEAGKGVTHSLVMRDPMWCPPVLSELELQIDGAKVWTKSDPTPSFSKQKL